ncbi:pyrokinin-1 receptor-like [Pieris napi]|uniref:pyrokinin-1 receptor-like n=1 Tax=Pieris napi TaxID=78633 RepID=UPI001FBAC1EE|nr:pyrokinin-1 receptor-like [Pieris napi]
MANLTNDTYTSYGIGMSFHDENTSFEESNLVKIILSVVLSASMTLSLIGNCCTCAVICRERSMRIPTNYYLLNLAITDLMTALFIPIEIYMLWVQDYYPLGDEGCRMHFLIWDVLSNCSVLTILAFTVERYLVISKPFLRQRLALNSRVFKIIAAVWIIACIFSIPNGIYAYLVEKKENIYCCLTVKDNDKIYLIAVELIVFFVVPMTVIFVLYVLIALNLKSKRPQTPHPALGKQNKNKAVKMLAAVAASFFICWSPYTVLRLIILIPRQKYNDYFQLERIFLYLSTVNSYLSTAINPILYSLMSRKFRHAFKDLLRSRTHNRNHRNQQGCNNLQLQPVSKPHYI